MAESAAPRPTVTTSGAGVAAAVAAAASPTRILTVPSVPGGGSSGGSCTKQVTCRYFMRGVCKEGDNCCYLYDLSDSPYNIVCKYFQRGYCIYGDCYRYEHSKSFKQEEATATELTTNAPLVEMNTGEAESRNSNFATVRADSEDWVNAIEFVPGQLYHGCTAPSCTEAPLQGSVTKEESEKEQTAVETKKQLWPCAAVGECRYRENCVYVHGDSCDMCGLQVLHPMDAGQRPQHIKSCTEAHEKDMELSFAVQRSKEIVCGICMEHRFGILSNCLRCIRKWRSAKQFESKVIKSCPECRITSNFVIPSEYWVEEEEEKQKLIVKYKEAMSNKACRYFDERHGAVHLEGTVFTSMCTLMAIERSHRDRKWEHQADNRPNEGTASGNSLRKERTAAPLTTMKKCLSPLSWASCCLCFWLQVGMMN
uniref:RING-type E3 ubiquitin transferase n=1 Tax=Rhinopithecus roxellana TaxID=61622 RepID=A0A2K6R3N0_RHIRO